MNHEQKLKVLTLKLTKGSENECARLSKSNFINLGDFQKESKPFLLAKSNHFIFYDGKTLTVKHAINDAD